MHFNMKKAKFRRMSIISNTFDVRTSQRVKKPHHTDDELRKKDKQLLTPNIKRFLKTWLLDHKDYPYPDRYEKIMLAQETGLTIMQICNWFANWRRKLKLYSKDFKRRSYKATEDRTGCEIEEDSDDTQHRTTLSWTSQLEPDWIAQTRATNTTELHEDGKHSHAYSNQHERRVLSHAHRATNRTVAVSEAAPEAAKPKLWRPQEDLGVENKQHMLLKWLKSISTYDSLKYHPCYARYAWDSDRVKLMLHEDRVNLLGTEHIHADQISDYDRLKPKVYDALEPYRASQDHRYTDPRYYPGSDRTIPVSGRTIDHAYESSSQGGNECRGDVHLDEVRRSDEILAAEILASFAQNRQKDKLYNSQNGYPV